MIYRVSISSPYGEGGVRTFEVDAVDYLDAQDMAEQVSISGVEKIFDIRLVFGASKE